MDDPMASGFLPYPFLHERFLTAKQLHGQFVISGLEEGLQLIFEEALLATVSCAHGGRPRLLFRRAVEADIVAPEMYFSCNMKQIK